MGRTVCTVRPDLLTDDLAMPSATAVIAAAAAIVIVGAETVVAAEEDQNDDDDPGAATKTVTHIEYASFRLQYIL